MLDDIEHEVCDVAGVNINVGSGQQLSSVLYGGSIKQEVRELRGRQLKSGKFKVTTRKGTYNRALKGLGFKPIKGTECKNGVSWKTDVGTLKFLRASSKKQKQILELLTTRSKYGKIVSTFESVKKSKPSGLIHQVGNDGRIHPSFNQTTTVTGRLSSSNPNAQNLPRKGTSPIKQVFKSQRGKIVNVDLSQIEFRIGAALSNDVVMKDEIKHGLDTHSDNAEKFFKKNKERDGADEFKAARQAAKTMTFRLLYGGTANGFAKDPTMPKYSKDEWQDIVTQYFDKYKILHAWQQRNIKSVMTYGALRNPSGRIFVFDRKRGYDNEMTYNPAEACNYPVQSASADLIFLAMRELMQRVKRAKLRCDFIITVHDSVVFDCHDDDVQKLCELGLQTFRDLPKLALDYFDWEIDVPLTGECEVGDTYGSMKAVFPCKHCGKFGRHNEDDPICPDCANAYDVAA